MRYLTFILVMIFAFSSCKSRRQEGERVERLKNKSVKELIELLDQNQLHVNWMNSKGYVDLKYGEEEMSLKSNLRMRVDSATWVSFSKASLPAMTVLTSVDSVKTLFKVPPKKYYLTSFDSINQLLNSEVDYFLLQDFFLGNPIAFDKEADYKSYVDGQFYLLSSDKSKKIERMLERGKEVKSKILYKCWLEPNHFKAARVNINLIDKQTTLEVVYSDWQEIEGNLYPMKGLLSLETPTNEVSISVDYSKVAFNVKQRMPFKITSSYEPLEIQVNQGE